MQATASKCLPMKTIGLLNITKEGLLVLAVVFKVSKYAMTFKQTQAHANKCKQIQANIRKYKQIHAIANEATNYKQM